MTCSKASRASGHVAVDLERVAPDLQQRVVDGVVFGKPETMVLKLSRACLSLPSLRVGAAVLEQPPRLLLGRGLGEGRHGGEEENGESGLSQGHEGPGHGF